VVHAVASEPLSARTLQVTGKNTGKTRKKALWDCSNARPTPNSSA
jgi:hypothetical protein